MLEKQLDFLKGKKERRWHCLVKMQAPSAPPLTKFQHLGYPWLPLLGVTHLSGLLGQKARQAFRSRMNCIVDVPGLQGP